MYLITLNKQQLTELEELNNDAKEILDSMDSPESSAQKTVDRKLKHARKHPLRIKGRSTLYELFLEAPEAHWLDKVLWVFERQDMVLKKVVSI